MANGPAPVIIKKVVKGGGEGHHGGAWKVAYADFVTAMMAFFLLMWLLNATTERQRKGLADYFDPSIPLARISAGGQEMLAGDTVTSSQERTGSADPRPAEDRRGGESPEPGTIEDGSTPPPETFGFDVEARIEAGHTPNKGTEAAETPDADTRGGLDAGEDPDEDPGAAAFEAAMRAEEARLAALGSEIEAAVNETGEAAGAHLDVRLTPEGLVIEVADTGAEPLFDAGSSAPSEYLTALLKVISPVVALAANPVAIVGHTDATPIGRADFDNWDLSSDRANAARRLMIAAGLPEARLARVSGRGATEPLANDPDAPQNRRIAITLLRTAAR